MHRQRTASWVSSVPRISTWRTSKPGSRGGECFGLQHCYLEQCQCWCLQQSVLSLEDGIIRLAVSSHNHWKLSKSITIFCIFLHRVCIILPWPVLAFAPRWEPQICNNILNMFSKHLQRRTFFHYRVSWSLLSSTCSDQFLYLISKSITSCKDLKGFVRSKHSGAKP